MSIGEPCDTGFPGVCAAGEWSCELGQTVCAPLVQPAAAESCNGLDDTCDGYVDQTSDGERLVRAFYRGPEGTEGVGQCTSGVEVCEDGAWAVTTEQVVPGDERCDGLDWSCSGTSDDVTEAWLRGNRDHCGECGNACEAWLDCREGECVCTAGTEECGSACVDVQSSNVHCGECGNACPPDAICMGGTCNCGVGRAACGGRCVDLVIDRSNCGECGRRCATEQLCESGECRCPLGRTLCGELCVDVATNTNHCGACGDECPAGQICSGGVCGCPAGAPVCDGVCTDLQNDRWNCGECGTECLPDQVCSTGNCLCLGETSPCPGGCRNLSNDTSNCGSCGTTCHADQACSGGQCTCSGGGSLCPDGCRNLSSDTSNCGSCGTTCHADQTCSGGECRCPSGNSLCPDGCRNLSNDTSNCGSCGNGCAVGQQCVDGGCVCPGGGSSCPDGCRDLTSDNNNCGSCGNACQGDTFCSNGQCRCAGGTSQCGTACVPQQVGSSCYTASGGTPGVGVCSSGTWTCSGESAVCAGQTGPETRVCDGRDNNCNGTVDDGCPSAIQFGPINTGPFFGGTGGTGFTRDCLPGQVVVGVEVRSGSRMDRLQLRCQSLALVVASSVIPHTFTIDRTGTSSLLPANGGTGGTPASFTCPPGEVVVEISGRSGGEVDRFQVRCGRYSVTGSSPGGYGTSRSFGTLSPAWGGTGGTPFTYTCPDEGALRGIFVRSGSRIDRVQPRCNTVGLQIR